MSDSDQGTTVGERLPSPPRDAAGLGRTRRWFRALVRRHRPDACGDLTDDAVMVLDELVTNAVVHGHVCRAVTVDLAAGRVRMEIDDANPRLAHAGEGAGLGLRLVARGASRWGQRCGPEGKTVWAELPLSRSPADHRGES
ncbi:ATP-binding protein [Amycolatopsis azurea]|uniref:ATP-binding protein n=1 Tax=Amycolatopsis azurea TaxID=36819 RepID=UPI001177E328|nr:ATP-binding protein [Amycolatopsis azurea]